MGKSVGSIKTSGLDRLGKPDACPKCGKARDARMYYAGRHGYMPICKVCICHMVDATRPSSFLWVLKDLDFPYVEDVWLKQVRNTYASDPDSFTSDKVLGRYVRTMKMKYYLDKTWDDTIELNKERGRKFTFDDAEVEADRKKEEELTKRLDAGDINAEEYIKLRGDINSDVDESLRQKVSDIAAHYTASVVPDGSVVPTVANQLNAMAAPTMKSSDYRRAGKKSASAAKVFVQPTQVPQDMDSNPSLGSEEERANLIAGAAPMTQLDTAVARAAAREERYGTELSEKEKRDLAMKWGDNYSLSDYIRMERTYQSYTNAYDMTVDREEMLKKICKVNLKLDQAIENDDTQDAQKLAQMLNQMRTSAKLTDAQKKEMDTREIDSLGELVAAVEREGDVIDQFQIGIDYPQDKIDLIIKDQQAYIYRLVKEDLGLGDLIESYVQKLEAAERAKESTLGNSLMEGLITSRSEDTDFRYQEEVDNDKLADDFIDSLADRVKAEADKLIGGM